MVTSEVPEMTLVFLGGMTMVGAMGSAGPPTSTAEEKCENEKTMRAWTSVLWHTGKGHYRVSVFNRTLICHLQVWVCPDVGSASRCIVRVTASVTGLCLEQELISLLSWQLRLYVCEKECVCAEFCQRRSSVKHWYSTTASGKDCPLYTHTNTHLPPIISNLLAVAAPFFSCCY